MVVSPRIGKANAALSYELKRHVELLARDFARRMPTSSHELAVLARQTLEPRLTSVSSQELNAAVIHLLGTAASNELRSIREIIDSVINKLDSMSELGETESLRLQMAMDRVSKFLQTLSDLEKKISNTDSQIAGNLK